MVTKSRLEISKTAGGYFRVYKVNNKWAVPFSPREFLNKADARAWIKKASKKLRR